MPLTTISPALQDSQAQYTGFKNRIINGDMRIDQRNSGASVTPTNVSYTLDRWQGYLSQTGKFTVQRNAGSVTPPAGFTNYLGATSSSAYSLLTGDFFAVAQPIEGVNVADLAWGTANAATVTVSFKVYSSLTGTFGGSLQSSGGARSYPFTYTISSANTWTTIAVTVPGDTTGTWLKDTGIGLNVIFGLGVGTTYSGAAGSWAGANYFSATGATSVVSTNGATFYITGVQFEKGSVATAFDYRPYGTELALCQRYYEVLAPASVMLPWSSATQIIRSSCSFQVTKRASPSINMGTKGGGTGTMGAASVSASGVTYFGSGSLGDVIEYPTPTASIEL